MRSVVLALSLILIPRLAIAQSDVENFNRMANDSIERANRRHAEERRYEEMRQDYIRDTQQAIRQEREDWEALERLKRNNRPKFPAYEEEQEYEPLGADY